MIRIILFFFIFFLLLMFLMGFSVIRMFRKMLFGGGANEKRTGQQRPSNKRNSGQSRASREQQAAPQRKKLFPKDEGEYVDYEEIKE
ncbi:MAG: DUF4834 family protein [Tannerellaceae bacterium]|jgi:hypothetical protein|nr:DUF4834 family protein [Tannerellaceae bacterium]